MTATITVYPEESPRLIFITSAENAITQQELLNLCREWEQDPVNLTYNKLITSSGKEDLGGGVTVGITNALQNAKIAFNPTTTSISSGTATSINTAGTTLTDAAATFVTDGVLSGSIIINFTDMSVATVLTVTQTQLTHQQLNDGSDNTWKIGDTYKIWNITECDASGGNLTALNESSISISPILPTAFNQIVKTSSASATLQELSAIQYSSYQNGVTIDTVNGTDGTNYPQGTNEYPVKTLSDAKIIAVDNGFTTFFIKENITFTGTVIISGYKISGEGQQKTINTLQSGVTTNNTHFESMSIQGAQKGETYYYDCEILTLTNVHCQLNHCALIGPITMHATWTDTTQLIDCYNGNITITPCIINHNNGKVNMRFSKYTGSIKFINITDASAEFVIAFSGGGALTLDASDTAGNMRLFGNVTLEGTSGGLILQDSSTGDVVWTHKYESDEYPAGTFGNYIGKKMLTISKYLGLK